MTVVLPLGPVVSSDGTRAAFCAACLEHAAARAHRGHSIPEGEIGEWGEAIALQFALVGAEERTVLLAWLLAYGEVADTTDQARDAEEALAWLNRGCQ